MIQLSKLWLGWLPESLIAALRLLLENVMVWFSFSLFAGRDHRGLMAPRFKAALVRELS